MTVSHELSKTYKSKNNSSVKTRIASNCLQHHTEMNKPTTKSKVRRRQRQKKKLRKQQKETNMELANMQGYRLLKKIPMNNNFTLSITELKDKKYCFCNQWI